MEEDREKFLSSLMESMKIGAKNMFDPSDGKIIRIGGKEFNELFVKYDLLAEDSSDDEREDEKEIVKEEPIEKSKKFVGAADKLKAKRGKVDDKKESSKKEEHTLTFRERFFANPNVNPRTNRAIVKNGPAYKTLVSEFGDPFA